MRKCDASFGEPNVSTKRIFLAVSLLFLFACSLIYLFFIPTNRCRSARGFYRREEDEDEVEEVAEEEREEDFGKGGLRREVR